MARKVTIGKEKILEAALRMLIRDGYQSVNIKTLAKEIGCSTQPIVWHFNNMEGLRNALAEYAADYAKRKAAMPGENAVEAFEHMGKAYIEMALNEPNLFKYLYLGGRPKSTPYNIGDISAGKYGEENTASRIAEQLGLTREQAVRCIQNTVIYSHGLASMIATGVFMVPEQEIMAMIRRAADGFIMKERA